MTDRRAGFFLLAALVCLALSPVAPEQFRSVGLGLAAAYAVMAALSLADHIARGRHHPRR